MVVQAARRGRPRARLGRVRLALVALGVSATATWFLQTVSTRVQRRFRDKVTIALESHVATLLASIATIAHQERPEYLDRLSVLRNQVFMLDHMYMSLFTTCGWILRLGVTIALLVSIHPALGAAGALRAAAGVDVDVAARQSSAARTSAARRPAGWPATCSTWRRRRRRARRCASPASAIGWSSERRQAWEAGNRPIAARAVGVGGLAHAGVGDLRRRLRRRDRVRRRRGCTRPPATCCWRSRPGRGCRSTSARRSARLGSCAASGWTAARRLAWLEDYAAALVAAADQPRPDRLAEGIRFEHVSFAYPGTDRLVLDDVTLALPGRRGHRDRRRERRGQDHAGEAAGEDVRADRRPHPRRRRSTWRASPPTDWRARLAGAFQDFFRFEFRARHTVGVGDVPRLDDEPAVVDGGRAAPAPTT